MRRKIDPGTVIESKELQERIKIIFYGEGGMVTKELMNDMLEFVVLTSNVQEFEPEWEDTIVKAFDEVMHMEEQLKSLPEIPMKEIEEMVTRFIEYARKEREKGNQILEDSLL